MKAEDVVQDLFICSTHSYMLILTSKGRLYWLKALYVPDVGVSSRGKSIKNLVQLEPKEKVSSVVAVKDFSGDQYVVMLASNGLIKKSKLSDFRHIRKGGIIAINLRKKSELLMAKLTDGKKDILIGTKQGKVIRFKESEIRSMGRQAAGVKAISLSPKDEIIGMIRQIGKGIRVDDETLALDVLDEVGPGGEFVSHDHTFDHWKEWYRPTYMDRSNYETWINSGKKTFNERIEEQVDYILDTYEAEPLDENVLEEMKKIIDLAEKRHS